MTIDAMKQALEALELWSPALGHALNKRAEAVVALRAAIEHAERPMTHSDNCWKWHHGCAIRRIERAEKQEPVAWMYHGIRHDNTPHERPSLIWKPEYMDAMSAEKGVKATPLYAAPRQWQALTDEEIAELHHEIKVRLIGTYKTEDIYRAIEAKLKEKNT